MSVVNKNKRLLFPNSDIAHTVAAQTGLFNKPGRRKLVLAARKRIRNHGGIRSQKLRKQIALDSRILKEAACIANLRRIRKFSSAQCDYTGKHVFRP